MRWVLVSTIVLLLVLPALGHEVDIPHEEYDEMGIEERVLSRAATVMTIAGILVIVFTVLSMVFHERRGPIGNWVLFLGIAVPVVIATTYSAVSTVQLNLQSETQGPVHWHADFEIWVCGIPVELQAPAGISNRLGTALFHEHGDLRIHAEGVLLKRENAALGRFFHVIGGLMTHNTLGVPTREGLVVVSNDIRCPDGRPGVLQVFRWHTRNGLLVQEKLDNFQRYVLAPESLVPPGDCLIIEFGPEKPFTDKLCASYRAALARGEIHGG